VCLLSPDRVCAVCLRFAWLGFVCAKARPGARGQKRGGRGRNRHAHPGLAARRSFAQPTRTPQQHSGARPTTGRSNARLDESRKDSRTGRAHCRGPRALCSPPCRCAPSSSLHKHAPRATRRSLVTCQWSDTKHGGTQVWYAVDALGAHCVLCLAAAFLRLPCFDAPTHRYCTSEGPFTNLHCLHCQVRYCG